MVILSPKGWPAGEEFVKGSSKGIDVGSVVDGNLAPPGLLRAHVERRSNHVVGECEARLPLLPRKAEIEYAQPTP
ncbi:MAG: hypothetical protein V3R16_01220, partial [Nitrospirales bacterium]